MRMADFRVARRCWFRREKEEREPCGIYLMKLVGESGVEVGEIGVEREVMLDVLVL